MVPHNPMAVLFGLITVATAVMLLGTVINYFTAPRLERTKPLKWTTADPPQPRPARVSLLIPARNEAANMRILLPMLAEIEYPDLEILILDDDSQDETAKIVTDFTTQIRLIKGAPLRAGWLGKNWACAQLAEAATGDILIFCDADVRVGPGAVSATVEMMQSEKWDALTGMPRQLLGTWAEKAVIPVLLFMPVLGFVPIALIPKLRHPLLSLGCGQWFAFTRAQYDRMGGHASVRNVIVEDMALGRLVKETGGALGAAIVRRDLGVRMYTGFQSLWNGFSKNLAYLTGDGLIRPIVFLSIYSALHVLPISMLLLGNGKWLIPVVLWWMSRLICAWLFREPPMGWLWSWTGVLLIPIMCARSWWGYRRRSVQWKGRELNAAFAAEFPDDGTSPPFHLGKETAEP